MLNNKKINIIIYEILINKKPISVSRTPQKQFKNNNLKQSIK